MKIQTKSKCYDAIIVLANLMSKAGILNKESIARAKMAFDYHKKMNILYIVTCGWPYRSDSYIAIGTAFKNYLVENLGANPNKIITEINSRDTVGDAFFTKKNIAIPFNWKNICVITSSYHVDRTQEIFNFIYGDNFIIDVYGTNIDCGEKILNSEKKSLQAFRETFHGVNAGDDVEIYNKLRERHPFYNGEIYNKI